MYRVVEEFLLTKGVNSHEFPIKMGTSVPSTKNKHFDKKHEKNNFTVICFIVFHIFYYFSFVYDVFSFLLPFTGYFQTKNISHREVISRSYCVFDCIMMYKTNYLPQKKITYVLIFFVQTCNGWLLHACEYRYLYLVSH